MFCANFGKEVRARRVEFCPFCGEKLEKGDDKKAKSAGAADRKILGIPMSRRNVVIAAAVAVLVAVIAVVVGIRSAGLGFWECDRCDREWFGSAYSGKQEDTVICKYCAVNYWSPSRMEEHRIESNW